MQQLHESRCPMRQKVRSLAKFQMQRLVSRRVSSQNQVRFRDARRHRAHQREESIAFEPRVWTEPPSLLGLPGYRTQTGHTGLDPIETLSEMAFLQGKFIRLLITGQLQTNHPISLAAMALAGVGLIVPFVFCLLTSMYSGWNEQRLWVTFALAPFALIGWMLWIDLNVSLRGDHRATSLR